MTLKFKRLHEAAQLPTRATPTDSGMDLYAVDDTVLLPGVPTLVQTGLAVEMPESRDYSIEYIETDEQYEKNKCSSAYDVLPITFEAQIRPRSGLALKHGIQVLNSPGTVDNAYRGPIGVILLWSGHAPNAIRVLDMNWNPLRVESLNTGIPSYEQFGDPVYRVRKGDRIAQLVIAPVVLCGAEWADELTDTDRAGGGFGSTGK